MGREIRHESIAKLNFHSPSVFLENVVAIEMRKLEVQQTNLRGYVHFRHIHLYEFYHDYMSSMYREKCNVIYTDTDSLTYHIEYDDVYEIIKRDISRFNMSNYEVDNVYGIPLVKKSIELDERRKQ